MSKIKIYMGLTTTGNVIDSQAYILRDLAETYKEQVEFVYPTECVRRMFHDYARNIVVEDFLASDCDILWFLDSDITPPKHVLDLVCLHKDWKVAGATYPVFMTPVGSELPEIVFTCYKKNAETGNLSPSSVPQSGIEYVDGLATGCLFIKREVFSTLSRPYFEFKYEPETRDMIEGEDLGFCRKLNAQGIQFLTDYSMACRHQKHVDLLDLNNYAINYSNRSVLRYDAAIKDKINAALQNSYNQGYEKALKDLSKQLNTAKQAPTIWTPDNVITGIR